MTVWIVMTLMSCVAAVLVAVPLIRRYEANAGGAHQEIALYRQQLLQIARELASGDVSPEEARAAELEVQRRMIAVSHARAPDVPTSQRWKHVALATTTCFIVLVSANLYGLYGHPNDVLAPMVAKTAPQAASIPSAGSVDDKIAALASRLNREPGDAEGWRMLGWAYFNTGRYDDAADALSKAVNLAPGDANYLSSYGEALVQRDKGRVSPEALRSFEAALASDPSDHRARFYIALAQEQAGNLQQALDRWLALLADAPADAPWLMDVRAHVTDLGERTGRDVTRQLASGAAPAADSPPAAGGDQQAMIAGMVQGLADRLEANPHDLEGWMRLIRSRMVLDQKELASEALDKALTEFKDDSVASLHLSDFARELGVRVN